MTIRSMLGSQAIVMVPTRNSSAIGASSGSTSRALPVPTDGAGAGRTTPDDLVEDAVEVLGEHRDLLLLARDAGDAVALTGLEEEGALARACRRCRRRTGPARRSGARESPCVQPSARSAGPGRPATPRVRGTGAAQARRVPAGPEAAAHRGVVRGGRVLGRASSAAG